MQFTCVLQCVVGGARHLLVIGTNSKSLLGILTGGRVNFVLCSKSEFLRGGVNHIVPENISSFWEGEPVVVIVSESIFI